MDKRRIAKQDSDRFGRHVAIVLTRATMYKPRHPYVKQSSDALYHMAKKLLETVSPLVFSLHREQCFVDEEPLDPRVNVSRLISHFKNVGIESISFYKGLSQDELETFLELYVDAAKYPDIDSLCWVLVDRSVKNLRINHVIFTKITRDQKITSRDANQEPRLAANPEDTDRSKKLLYDVLFEGALTDALEESLNVASLVENPSAMSRDMIQRDMKSYQECPAKDRHAGPVLLNQLDSLGKKVDQTVKHGDGVELSRLAEAIFELKRQLMEGIEAQKALDVSYSDEESIRSKADEITDSVLIRLVREEYKAGKISAARLAQILRRLIPETDELKRVLPKIKRALLEEGMPVEEYWKFVREIGKELQSDELARVLQESSEEAGVDGRELIQQIKRNPVRVAELICLAAEVQKATGDAKLLTELLVDYVERLGPELALDSISKKDGDPDKHLRGVIAELEVNIGNRLRTMNVGGDVLAQLEERINKRLDEILERFKNDLTRSHPVTNLETRPAKFNLLDVLEQTAGENAELREVLSTVRAKVQSEVLNQNDFGEIHAEILKQIQIRRRQQAKGKTRPGLLQPRGVTFLLRKEMARAKRYNISFSVLCFSLVKGLSQDQQLPRTFSQQALIDAILNKLAIILRDADVLGQLEKGRMIVLLPMTEGKQARSALRRCLKVLNSEPLFVDEIPVSPKITGIAHGFDPSMKPDVDAFVKAVAHELEHMISRVKNLGMFL